MSRPLSGHTPRTPGSVLRDVAKWCEENQIQADVYGTGDLIEGFETKVADLLGFEAARYMPSGTMVQQIALRVWSERAGNPRVGMHPTSHLELHEQRGYASLHQLQATLVGPRDTPLLAKHFTDVRERLSALLIELPIREAGGQLPTWEELEELKSAVRESGTRFHVDGARLWECAAWYDKPYQEICTGFDSCYVSFYKGIGALSGAMLLGPKDFIDEAAIWQRRCGGNLYSLAPNVASAAMQLDERVAQMPAYFERACSLATAIDSIAGIQVLPNPPHTNMMHVFLPMTAETANARRDAVAKDRGLWLFGGARPAELPGHSRFELYVGDAAMALSDEEVTEAFTALAQ